MSLDDASVNFFISALLKSGPQSLNGVGVKARAATAKRRGLDAHGMTKASGEWGQGSLYPLPPEPSAARAGFQRAEPFWARAEGPLQVKKSHCRRQAFHRPKAVLSAVRHRLGRSPIEIKKTDFITNCFIRCFIEGRLTAGELHQAHSW